MIKLSFAVLCAVLVIACASCNWMRNSVESPPKEEVEPAKNFEEQYTTPDQLAFLQAAMIDAEYINRAFMDMSGNILYNVASVCINRFGATTKKQVVIEYTANKEIYDNLKSPPDSMNTETTSTPSSNNTNSAGTAAGATGPPDNIQLNRVEGDTIIGGVLYRKITYQYGNKSE